MHLKKLLITLISLSFILAFSTSCENDRDKDEAELTLKTSDLANTYTAKQLIINASEAEEGASVVVIIDSEDKATFKLVNLVEEHPELIFTTAITQKENGAYAFTYTTTLQDGTAERDVQFNGSFVGSPDSNVVLVVDFQDVKELEFADLSREYLKEDLIVNGNIAKNKISATVEVDGNGVGTIVLNNITIGQPEHKFTVKFLKDAKNTFSFVAEEEENADNELYKKDRVIKVTGTIVNNVLTVDHAVKILSNVVGDWELKIENTKNGREAELSVSMATRPVSIVITRMFVLQAVSALRPVLGEAVESVSLQFSDNGKLKIGYTEIVAPKSHNIRVIKDEASALPIDLDYYVRDGIVYLAIQEELLNALPLLLPAEFPITVDEIKSIFEKNGMYYALPLRMEVKKDHTLFYINEVFLANLIQILEPAIEKMIPEEGFTGLPIIGTISKKTILTHVNNLKTAQNFKFGLGFKKIESISLPQ